MSDAETRDHVDQFVEEYVRTHRRKRGEESTRRTAMRYARALRGTDNRLGWFEWLREKHEKSHEDATPKDVERYLDYLYSKGYSDDSQTGARSAISQYHQKMEIEGANPVDGVEASWTTESDKKKATGQERYYLSEDQMRDLIDNVPTPTLRNELIIKLLYHTGCRRSELASMRIDNMDREEREVDVWDEKDEDWRTVTFREGLRGPLNLWIEGPRKDVPGYEEDNPYLFPSPTDRGERRHISGETIRKVVKTAAENAGIQKWYNTDAQGRERALITPHAIRHTFAVHAAENDVPAPHLKKILGHTKLDVTQIYLEVSGNDAADVLKNRGPSI